MYYKIPKFLEKFKCCPHISMVHSEPSFLLLARHHWRPFCFCRVIISRLCMTHLADLQTCRPVMNLIGFITCLPVAEWGGTMWSCNQMKNAKSQNLHLQKYENTVQLNFGKKFWSLAMDFGWKNEEKLEDLIRFIQSIIFSKWSKKRYVKIIPPAQRTSVIYFKDVHLQNNFDLGVGNVERGDKICCRGARVNIGDIDEMVSIHMSPVSSWYNSYVWSLVLFFTSYFLWLLVIYTSRICCGFLKIWSVLKQSTLTDNFSNMEEI